MRYFAFLVRSGCYFALLASLFGANVGLAQSRSELEYFARSGKDMFRNIYTNESQYGGLYQSSSLEGTRDLLNRQLADLAQEICAGCDMIAQDLSMSDLDTIQQQRFLPAQYLDPSLTLSREQLKRVTDAVVHFIAQNKTELLEQQKAFRSISGLGIYMDWDVSNSDFDLIEDVSRIQKRLYETLPEPPRLTNTNPQDAKYLITWGAGGGGGYVGDVNYDIDLAGDVTEALFGKKKRKETYVLTSDQASENPNAMAGSQCENAVCLTVEFVTSQHALLGGSSKSIFDIARKGSSYEGLYQEHLGYMTKISKKNLYPSEITKNFMQFDFGQNLKLSEIFSAGIIIETRSPSFLKGFAGEGRVLYDSAKKNTTASETPKKDAAASTKPIADDAKRKKLLGLLDQTFTNSWFASYAESNNLLDKNAAFQDTAFYNQALDSTLSNFTEKFSRAFTLHVDAQKSNLLDPITSQKYFEQQFEHLEKFFLEVDTNIASFTQGDQNFSDMLYFVKSKREA